MSTISVQQETAAAVASMLLQIEAIKLNVTKPFTWSSGWKSPIYCDNRLALSYPEIRKSIRDGLTEAVQHNFPSVESIAGVATAGIPQGVLVADALNLPFIYVRPKPKGHGMENLIEGKITKKQRVVVIEDLVSTGGSSLKATQALREAGFTVEGMVSVFNYGFDVATENFSKENVSLVSLCDYNHLLKFAAEQKYVTEEQLVLLKAWRVDPANWNT